jgi:hypothetical protein
MTSSEKKATMSLPITQVRSPTATINDIPNELILEVVAYLHVLDSEERTSSSLLALSITNKRFNRLVVPELYATFDAYHHDSYLFLRTLLSTPHLASSVKHAHVSRRRIESRQTRNALDATDMTVIEEGLRLAGFAGWKPLAEACNKQPADIEIICTVILLHVPNLDSLEFVYGSEQMISDASKSAWMSLLEHATFVPASIRTSVFRHLLSLSITGNSRSIGKILVLFHLPSLQELRIDEIVLADEGEGRGAEVLRQLLPPGCNRIKSLRLHSCFIQADMLAILIASSRKLKIFWYQISLEKLDFDLRDQNELADMTLTNMLDIHKESLEELIIDSDLQTNIRLFVGLDLQQGLRNFTALTQLDCPLQNLISPGQDMMRLAEKLPPLLHGLGVWISRYKKDLELLKGLEHLSRVYEQHTPHLEFVWLECKANGPKLRYVPMAQWALMFYTTENLTNLTVMTGITFKMPLMIQTTSSSTSRSTSGPTMTTTLAAVSDGNQASRMPFVADVLDAAAIPLYHRYM